MSGLLSGPAAVAQDGSSEQPQHRSPIAGGRVVQSELRRAALFEGSQRWAEAARIYTDIIREAREPRAGVEQVVPDPEHEGVWHSAALHARERLLAFPEEGRKAFQDLFDRELESQLEGARAAMDEGRLIDLWRTYPIGTWTYQVLEALGDLAYERGDLHVALGRYEMAFALAGAEVNPKRVGLKLNACRERVEAVESQAREGLATGSVERWPTPGGSADHARPLPSLPGIGTRPVTAGLPVSREAKQWALEAAGAGRVRVHGFMSSRSGAYPDVLPAVADGRVVIATGGSIACYDVETAELLWQQRVWVERDTAPSRLFSGVTVADGRVFASFIHAVSAARRYRGIPITEAIPTRRLVAFDLQTGKRLWDHAAMEDDFLRTASVGLPPVEHDGRLYASAVVVDGAVKAYVVCADAATGRLLWRRFLGSGQVELTMFGNQAVEPLQMMPALHGGVVYCATGIGSLAGLDALTGEIRWLRSYETIPIHAARGYYAAEREIGWANTPPLVTGGTLVVTPLDGRQALGVDASTGALRWRFERGDAERLIGAYRGQAVVQGRLRIRVIEARTGKLRMLIPEGARERMIEAPRGQGIIAGQVALVPTAEGIARFDLESGRRLSDLALPGGLQTTGSLTYAAGKLLLTNPARLSIFEVQVGY